MKKRTWEPLGTLEAAVMKVVWKQSPVTAREVCDRMTGRAERAYTTIMTTMDRLHRKGLLEREKDGLAWRYTPALSQPEFEKALADGLAADILQSHGETALAAFVDAAAEVDESLLDRLAQLISERRRGRG
ncbi:BlaI/MecI/CopY family transcriptional regulator [Corallococcus carmarthensis]|uniref:BlaI/MecI/CopY family transcriptional regulator n=1 Tax=Corallococcus carmarthensis TaxID=2316728 RepID=A0A3A8KG40_9BACT|nr:BlaI/MecI/CopY family transcriptional regulator [Corallococcus carmarthensis]NOK19726.1 BlaI/MecI/CopY family transcriptional regulator [Corallococcus carmarthensis]RKH07113.1 BlaI/MecI/CopY family transcriptional regulator [Corallococcus carmarthensis]